MEVFQKFIKPRVWARNYDEGVPPEVDIRLEPLFTYLDRQVSTSGDAPAYIYFGRRVSFREVGDHSDRVAAALREWGLGRGTWWLCTCPTLPSSPLSTTPR